MSTMTFEEWRSNADMPACDSKGQWYDVETGIYFDPKAKPAIHIQLLQYWGKRAVIAERKDGVIEVSVQNSRLRLLGTRAVSRAMFDARPTTSNEAQVEWACKTVGIDLRS